MSMNFSKLGSVMQYHEPECHAGKKKAIRDQGHSDGSYDQNMTVFNFELRILFATKPGLMVHYYKPECLMKKLDCCVQGQGHNISSKCQ